VFPPKKNTALPVPKKKEKERKCTQQKKRKETAQVDPQVEIV